MENFSTSPMIKSNADVIRPASFVPSHQRKVSKRIALKPILVISVILLLIALPVIWFLLTARALVVETNPANALVKIEGGLQFQLDENYLLRQGEYQALATAEGYYPLQQNFLIGEAQNQQLSLTLIPLPGILHVTTNAETVGVVLIDNVEVGNTAADITDIAAGEHTLTVTVPRYKTVQNQINIEGKNQRQPISVQLSPDWADIYINSTPAGANVIADGEFIGVTPLNAELLSGVRELGVELQGYQSWRGSVDVVAEQGQNLPEITLVKLEGEIVVASQPAGAGVTINGKFIGLSPVTVALAPDQTYQVRLFKDGYEPVSRTVNLASEQSVAVNSKLTPLLASIALHSAPDDALLYVDDVLMGRANQTLTLTAKNHQIVVKKDGYVDFTAQVLPKIGAAQSLEINMKTLEQAKWENIPRSITTKTGTKLSLFQPEGKVFEMGASRREQGRRANETQRRIRLSKPFYFATTETTNHEFRQFMRQHSSGHVQGKSLNSDNYPVVKVSWQQAALFCNWLSEKESLPAFYVVEGGNVIGVNSDAAGYRLPFEAEWAWLARFHNRTDSKYVWGDQLPALESAGNIADRSGALFLGDIQVEYNDNHAVTAPIASFKADNNGLFDLSGNVAEWMTDFYEIKTGLSSKIEDDPQGPENGSFHVIRGSSWRHGSMTELRQAFRDYGEEGRDDLGFRIARYVE